MKRFADFIIEKRLPILLVMIGITIFFLYQAIAHLTVKTIYPDLLPRNHAYTKLHEQIESKFGGSNQVLIMLQVRDPEDGGKYKDIFNVETLTKVKAITEKLYTSPGVDRNKIMSLASRSVRDIKITTQGMSMDNIMFPDVPTTPEGLHELRQTVYGSPMAYPVLVSLDSKKTLIMVDYFQEQIDYRELFKYFIALRNEFEDENIIVNIAGEPMHLGYVDNYVMDVLKILGITVIAMMIMLYIFFRSIRGMVLPILAAAVSAIFGLGFLGLMRINLDPLVLVFPFLIAAMAASHSLQVYKRYTEEAYLHQDGKKACKNVIEHLFIPGFAGIITDAAGIMVIALTPIPILQKITLSCAFWAFATVAVAMILVPILLSYMPLRVAKEGEGWLDHLIAFCGRRIVSPGGRTVVLVVAAILLAWSANYSKNITIGSALPGSEILWPWHRYNTDAFRITFAMPLLSPLYVVVEGDKADAVGHPEVLRDIQNFTNYMRKTENMRVIMAFSILGQIPGRNRGVRDTDPNWSFMPNVDNQLRQLYKSVIYGSAPGQFDQYVDIEEQTMNVIIYARDKTTATIDTIFKRIYKYLREESRFVLRETDVKREGFDRFVYWVDGFFREKEAPIPAKPKIEGAEEVYYRLAGGAVGVQAAINECLTLYNLWTFVIALITVFLLCVIIFKNWMAGFMVTLPLILANTLAFAFMAFNKQTLALTTATLPVSAVGIGLGVDYGIYLLSRAEEECIACGNLNQAIVKAMGTTGKAIIYIATTLICGIIFWFLSKMMFQALMGFLLAIILMFNMLGSLIILPALLATFKPKFLIRHCK
ncbi:MAG: hypothetical protein FJ119_04490 [Deltaproteobacteria bacterium]|nr:hypothetical protein [Deltaproteobacteria bacterium]